MANTIEKFTIRLYYGDEEDEAVAKHLAQYDQYKGAKTAQARRLLYLGLQALEQGSSPHLDLDAIRRIVREEMAQATPSLDRDAVRDAVRQAMRDAANEGEGPDFTLSDIRQVVSVVLRQQLDAVGASEMTNGNDDDNTNGPPADAEAEKILDQLGESLMQ